MMSNKSKYLQKISLWLILLVCVFGVSPTRVFAALSQDQINALSEGIHYFNTEAGSACSASSGGTTVLTSNAAIVSYFKAKGYTDTEATNISEAFTYFVGKGLSAAQSAGVVGNLIQESNVSPTDGLGPPQGPSIGIGQWNEPGRWDTLKTFAQTEGKSPLDLGLQLDYMWHELTSSYASVLTEVKGTTTPEDAATDFSNDYEVDADGPHPVKRIGYANDVYAAATGTAAPTPTGTDPTTTTTTAAADCSSSGGAGFSGTVNGTNSKTISCPAGVSICFQNAVYYSQGSAPWGSEIFSPSHSTGDCIDVACSGCGVTAAAMAIASLTSNTSVNPGSLLPLWQQVGLTDSGGTGWGVSAWQQVATKYGTTVKNLAASSSGGIPATVMQQVIAALQAGDLVVVSGEDPNSTLFTTAGHFVMIRGATSATVANAQFLVNDPKDNFSSLSDTSKQWPASYFEQYGESVWVFSK